ncbi:hypothetical protein HHK36_006027 [Tetracentron sinense]|uniref:F-box domain-containing protein n=1 Tax=Tetracentron sinense TaxID=13715 RepID=A0A835DKH7_TETSI|nr:hypothetical protein HHK36_006027 [Tetracentron sinense]
MEDLPASVIFEILSRVNDSADLARCRLVSKTLNALSYEVRSLNLLCSFDRYLKSRALETKTLITPFKTIFKNLLLKSRNIESISVGVEKPLQGISDDDVDDESDDLYLTEVNFVSEWLPEISGRLRSLSISDFWIQSCWRRSEVLSVISSYCHNLAKLEVKNAWLSVEGLKPMSKLTSLTLKFVRLDDEDLNKVNDCFLSLEVLNLIGVGGLREPRIHLLHLKMCQWTVSNAPLSLTIHAPTLTELKLNCVKPKSLVLETPLLFSLHLSIEKTSEWGMKQFLNLNSLRIESTDLYNLICLFPCCKTVEKLMVDSPKLSEQVEVRREVSFEALFHVFSNLSSLTLGPGAWLELETCFRMEGLKGKSGMKGLREMVAHLVVNKVQITQSFISRVLDQCTNLFEMTLLIHRDVDSAIANNLISCCMADFPRVRWRWGMWKEGTKDTWVCNGVDSAIQDV